MTTAAEAAVVVGAVVEADQLFVAATFGSGRASVLFDTWRVVLVIAVFAEVACGTFEAAGWAGWLDARLVGGVVFAIASLYSSHATAETGIMPKAARAPAVIMMRFIARLQEESPTINLRAPMALVNTRGLPAPVRRSAQAAAGANRGAIFPLALPFCPTGNGGLFA